MFPRQIRIWFVLAWLENCFLSEKLLQKFFLPSFRLASPSSWACAGVSDFFMRSEFTLSNLPPTSPYRKEERIVPLCAETNVLAPSMWHFEAAKMWSRPKNVTFDSADWNWLLCNKRTHTHLCGSLVHICFTLRPSYTKACLQNYHLQAGAECFCLVEAVFWSVSHGAALMLVIHQRKSWPLAQKSYMGEGRSLATTPIILLQKIC